MKNAKSLGAVYIYIYISQDLIKYTYVNIEKLCFLDEFKNRLIGIVFYVLKEKRRRNKRDEKQKNNNKSKKTSKTE